VLWMLPFAWAVFAIQQTAIVPWEESILRARYPIEYRYYCERVPRWWPTGPGHPNGSPPYTWSHVLFSERGTLLAIALMTTVLLSKRLLQ
jgi:hypothetical protein